MPTLSAPHFTAEQYLEFDRDSEFKNEYIGGEIVPILGAHRAHAATAMNASFQFQSRLVGSKCRVYGSDLRVCLNPEAAYAHPDMTVIFGEVEYTAGQDDTLTNPKIIVEVLSRTTLNYDLGKKLRLYRKIESLTEILLIEQYRPWIEYGSAHRGCNGAGSS